MNEKKAKKILGRKIKEGRKCKGLTQEDLAKILDIKQAMISQIESGKKKPSFRNMLKLQKLLNIQFI